MHQQTAFLPSNWYQACMISSNVALNVGLQWYGDRMRDQIWDHLGVAADDDTGNHAAHHQRPQQSVAVDQPRGFDLVLLEVLGFDPLTDGSQVDGVTRTAAYLVLCLTALIVVFGGVLLAYVIKSALGIDLMPGPSPLHFIAEWLWY